MPERSFNVNRGRRHRRELITTRLFSAWRRRVEAGEWRFPFPCAYSGSARLRLDPNHRPGRPKRRRPQNPQATEDIPDPLVADGHQGSKDGPAEI